MTGAYKKGSVAEELNRMIEEAKKHQSEKSLTNNNTLPEQVYTHTHCYCIGPGYV